MSCNRRVSQAQPEGKLLSLNAFVSENSEDAQANSQESQPNIWLG